MKTDTKRFYMETSDRMNNGKLSWKVTNGTFSWIMRDVASAIRRCDQLNAESAENEYSKVRKIA